MRTKLTEKFLDKYSVSTAEFVLYKASSGDMRERYQASFFSSVERLYEHSKVSKFPLTNFYEYFSSKFLDTSDKM